MADDINRRIAEAQGWTNVLELDGGVMGNPPNDPSVRAYIPDYEHDGNAMLELLEEMGAKRVDIEWLPGTEGGEWTVTKWCGRVQESKAPTLPAAVAAAYLAWKELADDR